MIPAGYLLKRIKPPPGWLHASVADVCSVASCVNENIVDPQLEFEHNEFGLANTPEYLWARVRETGVSAEDVTLFYYEAYEAEIDRTYVSGVERGLRDPSIVVLARLAKVLKTTPAALLLK